MPQTLIRARSWGLRAISLSIALSAVLAPASAGFALAQELVSAPALAQDGRGLFNESPQTRAIFAAVWGDTAPGEWIQEHDADLSGGKTANGPRLGFLYAGAPAANPAFTLGLVSGLRGVGYHPGVDMTIVWRFADGRTELLPALAADLVRQDVDVIVSIAVNESLAAKQATATIPIVTMTITDPVGPGLASSLAQPGGNVTGVIQQPLDFNAERLAFLKQAVPNATRVALLTTVAGAASPAVATLRDAAPSLGLELLTLPVAAADDLPGALASAEQQSADAMMVLADTLFTANRVQIVRLATQSRIPALYPSRLFLDDGGLMDYGFVEASRGRRTAEYVAQILHGARPGDLPMGPPPEIELVVNLQAAQAIGFTVPPSVLDRATEVIR